MLKSVPHLVKTPFGDSDRENSSSELQERVARLKKHNAARSGVSESPSAFDLEEEFNALSKETSAEKAKESGEDSGILGFVVQEYELEENVSPPINTNLATNLKRS